MTKSTMVTKYTWNLITYLLSYLGKTQPSSTVLYFGNACWGQSTLWQCGTYQRFWISTFGDTKSACFLSIRKENFGESFFRYC